MKNNQQTQRALLDIVILVHGRFDLLYKCIQAIPLACGDITYKVILFDNASPKKDADEFYRNITDSHIKIVRQSQNYGFPRGCNMAVKHGDAPIILFLNSDVILFPDSIAPLMKDMDDETIGATGMKLLFPPDVKANKLRDDIRPAGTVQHVGMMTNLHGNFVHSFIGWSADNLHVNAVRNVYAVTGAALMTKRKLFQRVGGFDERYGQGTFEDVDYCLKLRELGYNIVVNVNAVGWHYTGATSETYQIGFPLNENRMLFMQRWASKLGYTEWVLW